jgi:lysophospholipase L1-like esterase
MGLLLALVMAEVFIRVYKRDIAYQPDPDLIRSLRPNVERKIYNYDTEEALETLQLPDEPSYFGMDYTNNVGFRMKEDVEPKREGEHRVLFLGDSFTEAQGYPEAQRFHGLVDRWLRARYPSWHALNAGIQNGNPSQYILQLRRYLPLVEPDIVLVVHGANDLNDDLTFEQTYGYVFDENGFPIAPKSRGRLWLLQKSWLLRYVKVFLMKRLPAFHRALLPPASPDTIVPPWAAFYCTDDRDAQKAYRDKTGRYLVELGRMAKAHGAEFGVVVIHYMWMFDHEPLASGLGAFRDEMDRWNCTAKDASPFNHFVNGFFREHGIDYVNTYDAMAESKRTRPRRKLWGYEDHHFSAAGHEIVAEEIEKLLPKLIDQARHT